MLPYSANANSMRLKWMAVEPVVYNGQIYVKPSRTMSIEFTLGQFKKVFQRTFTIYHGLICNPLVNLIRQSIFTPESSTHFLFEQNPANFLQLRSVHDKHFLRVLY